MTLAVVRRARALAAVAAALRGETGVLPTDAVGWSAFLELAGVHDVLPAVWVGQSRAGVLTMPSTLAVALEREAPPGLAVPEAVLRRAHDRNAARVQQLLDHGVDVLERFAAAGIRAVPLKGLHSLLCGTWPDPSARTMADLDILVDAEHATRAYELLRTGGYEEHPDPIGEHADHHLPMLRDGEVTVELHVEPLVSRWRALVPAEQMLRCARSRPTARGMLLLADDTDAFVHLVAHAQLQEETHTLLGLPLRALLETSCVDVGAIRWPDVRARFAAAGVGHVLDAHLHATRHWLDPDDLPGPADGRALRASRAHPAGGARCRRARHSRDVDLRGAGAALVCPRPHGRGVRAGRGRRLAVASPHPARGPPGGSAVHPPAARRRTDLTRRPARPRHAPPQAQ